MKWMRMTSLLVLLVATNLVSASEILNTQTTNTKSVNSHIITSVAKEWNLTESEWNRYLKLMQGLNGHYYQKLSPPQVLGINAETDEELRHFAEVSVKQEHDKLERELKFNTAFHEAASRLYITEQLIKPFDLTPFTPKFKN